MLDFIGNQGTFYPFDNGNGEVNIVSRTDAIAARILTVLLTRPGEDPIHPDLGIAPDLFQPNTTDAALAFVFQAQNVLIDWNERGKIGFEAIQVKVLDTSNGTGTITIEITFRPVGAAYNNVLTFGYWEYREAFIDQNLISFIETLNLI